MPIDINQNDGRVQIVAVGGETELDFDFPLFEKSHLRIIETDTNGDDVDLVLDTDYTIATDQLEVELGGVAVLTAGQYPTGAPAGYTYTLLLNVPEERTTDFNQAGDFFAATLNRELDLITQQNQQLRRDVNSAIRVPASSPITDLEIDTVTANAALVFNATADGLTSGPTTTEISNAQTYATNASASATAAAASAVSAAASAAKLEGTSTTSTAIGTGGKSFTTQADKFFDAGTWLLITSDADETNYMHGYVSSYTGTSLIVVVTNVGGSGTHTDWTIRVSGTQGSLGPGLGDGDKGDITVSSSGSVWTIDNDAVTYAKMQNVSAASRLLGRGSAAGAGDVEELTVGAGLTLSGTVLSGVDLTGRNILAWVRFNGTGTPAITDSYNVSSITDLGVGVYTVNLTNAVSNANYGIYGTVRANGAAAGNNMAVVINNATAPTTSAVTINTTNFAGFLDSTDVCLLLIGD